MEKLTPAQSNEMLKALSVLIRSIALGLIIAALLAPLSSNEEVNGGNVATLLVLGSLLAVLSFLPLSKIHGDV